MVAQRKPIVYEHTNTNSDTEIECEKSMSQCVSNRLSNRSPIKTTLRNQKNNSVLLASSRKMNQSRSTIKGFVETSNLDNTEKLLRMTSLN